MWTDVFSQNSSQAAWPLFLADLLLKITIVLAAGSTLAWLLRHRSAAVKHLVWTVSLISCLLVPVAMLLLPGWGMERALYGDPAPVHSAPVVPRSSMATDLAQPSPPTFGGDATTQTATRFPTPPDQTLPTQVEPPALISGDNGTANSALIRLLAGWLTGFVIVLVPLILGIVKVAVLRRQSATVSHKSWRRLAAEISRSLRFSRSVTLLRSHALDVPLCGGLLRPFVILPADSTWWTLERRRLVLLHELAHAKRRDVLVQWLCRLICAVYWFHPLVWFAARRMKAEQERACDDLVLAAGTTTAFVYAEHLVEIATECRSGHRHALAAAALVRRGELESRIRCILQTERARRPLSVPLRVALLLVMMGGMVSVATAGRVIVRDREGKVVATVPVPVDGTVTLEDETDDVQTDEDDLSKLIATVIEGSRERYLDAGRHTPYQIVRLLVPFGREHKVQLDGSFVNTVEFVSEGPDYDGEPWFQKTPHGGRAHTFTIPYAFEGHLNQVAAWLSAADLPLEHQFQTPDGPITIADMVRHAQATVNEREETTWTLWFLTKYLTQDAEWTNERSQPWSMRRLVQIQVNADVRRAPSGGRPQLYALTLARNARREQTGQLDGVWLEADQKIRRLIDVARRHQHPDGFFSSYVLSRPQFDGDWNDRVGATGSVLAWLSIALPPGELEADWIRNAARYLATELEQRRRAPIDVGAFADGLHGLIAYRQHAGPDPSGD